MFGSGTPKNSHKGFQPCFASNTNSLSGGTFDFTSSIHWLKNFPDLSGPALTDENMLSLKPGGFAHDTSFANYYKRIQYYD